MAGAVVYLEWLKASRRGRHHRLRHAYLGVLAVELGLFGLRWAIREFVQDVGKAPEALMQLSWGFFEFFAWQHFAVLFLLTPALAGGTVTEEKTRGTLGLLLTTPLTPAEIVAGKVAGGAGQALLLTLPVLPILSLLTALGGLDPGTLLWWAVETFVLALFLSSAAVLASVLARTTPHATIGAYFLLAAGLVAVTQLWGVDALPLTTPRQWSRQLGEVDFAARLPATAAWTVGAGLGLSLAFGVGAAAALRRAHVRFLAGPRRSLAARVFERPAVGNKPLRWKENYAGDFALLSGLRRLPRAAKVTFVCCVPFALAWAMSYGDGAAALICLLLVLGPGVSIGLRSAAAITSEREKQTWDSLLTTPLEPRQIVRGKLWGLIDSARPYMVPLLAATLLLFGLMERWVLLPLALLAWTLGWGFLYFQAANGIYWSARSTSSWQALLRTHGSATWSLFSRFYLAAVVGLVSVTFCFSLWSVFASRWALTIGLPILIGLVPLVVGLFAKAEEMLQKTEAYLEKTERMGQGER